MRRAIATTAIALALLGAVACSSDDDDDSTDATTAEQALCDSFAQLDQAVTDLRETDLVGEGTNELEVRISALEGAVQAVADDAGSTYEPAVQDLEDAFDALRSAVLDLGDGGDIQAVTSALGELSDAWQGLQDQTEQVRATCES